MVSHWPSVCPSVHPSVCCMSVNPSVFSFPGDNGVNRNGFSQNMVCTLILWRPCLGLQVGKFRQFLTKLSARHTIVTGLLLFYAFVKV